MPTFRSSVLGPVLQACGSLCRGGAASEHVVALLAAIAVLAIAACVRLGSGSPPRSAPGAATVARFIVARPPSGAPTPVVKGAQPPAPVSQAPVRSAGRRRVMPLEQATAVLSPPRAADLGDDDPLARTPLQDLTGTARAEPSSSSGLPQLASTPGTGLPGPLPSEPPPAPPLLAGESESLDVERQEIPVALRDRYRNTAPYGSVTVLAVRVSHLGRALQVEVLVPSANALTDIGYILGMAQLQLGPIEPPLQPGESRWIDIPINNLPNSILP